MTTICLIRHGQTDWNRAGILQGKTDIPLNKKGRRQAIASADYLKDFTWDALITSPLQRARQTAEVIQHEIKLPLIEREEFMERGYGKAEGLLPEERKTQFPDEVYPNQESMEKLTTRVMAGIEWIHQHYNGKRALLVTHGDVIKSILASVSFGNIHINKMNLLNACLNEIQYEDGRWQINYYNEIGHLKNM